MAPNKIAKADGSGIAAPAKSGNNAILNSVFFIFFNGYEALIFLGCKETVKRIIYFHKVVVLYGIKKISQ